MSTVYGSLIGGIIGVVISLTVLNEEE